MVKLTSEAGAVMGNRLLLDEHTPATVGVGPAFRELDDRNEPRNDIHLKLTDHA